MPTEDSRNAISVDSFGHQRESQHQQPEKRARTAAGSSPTPASFQPDHHQATPETLGGISDNGPLDSLPSTVNENYQPLSTEHTELEGLWDMDIDLNFFPSLFDLGSGVEWNEGHHSAPKEPEQFAARIIGPLTPLTPAAVAEIYNGSRSPVLEEEAMEPRQYQPSSIYIDAQLSFPNLEEIAAEEVDQEDLAHVPAVSQSAINQMTQLALTIETKSTYPPFIEIKIPPAPIINAWVQLYFEHFHPVFPFLHKPSFGNRDTHWLLIFAVSAIGAQFSGLPHSQDCSRAMNEMVRRAGSYLVSFSIPLLNIAIDKETTNTTPVRKSQPKWSRALVVAGCAVKSISPAIFRRTEGSGTCRTFTSTTYHVSSSETIVHNLFAA